MLKNLAIVSALFVYVCGYSQSDIFNLYGEPQTEIYRTSGIQPWNNDLLDAHEAYLKEKVGEAMFIDIYNHSNLSQFPPALNEMKKYWANETKIPNYKLWFVVDFNGGNNAVLRVSAKDNTHMGSDFLPTGNGDFYFVVDHIAIDNFSKLAESRKNTPESYKSYFAGKGGVVSNAPGAAEFNAGVRAYEKEDYATAFDQFTKSADKGNVGAMYNMGFMYKHNKVPKTNEGSGYNSNDVLNQVMNRDKELQAKYEKTFYWFKKSADGGDEKGMYEVGLMYARGEGVTKDLTEARKWLQKSYNAGYAEARVELDKL